MAYPVKLERVAIVGCGLMGHGIAQVFATAGLPVTLVGRQDAGLQAAMEKIEASLAEFVGHGLLTQGDATAARERITTSTDMTAAADAQLVVEVVSFDRELQRQTFRQLDEICPPPAVLASGSGEVISRIYDLMENPQRAVATHFWYPAQLLPIVEVCGGPRTDPDVITWVRDVMAGVGKVPAVLDREVDGFIGNRLQFALLREAWSMWADGVASAETIDTVVRNTIGRRGAVTGPIESADLAGLQTMHSFAVFLFPSLDTGVEPPAEVGALVEAGCRGPQSGRGVHDWTQRDGAALLAARFESLFSQLAQDRARRPVQG